MADLHKGRDRCSALRNGWSPSLWNPWVRLVLNLSSHTKNRFQGSETSEQLINTGTILHNVLSLRSSSSFETSCYDATLRHSKTGSDRMWVRPSSRFVCERWCLLGCWTSIVMSSQLSTNCKRSKRPLRSCNLATRSSWRAIAWWLRDFSRRRFSSTKRVLTSQPRRRRRCHEHICWQSVPGTTPTTGIPLHNASGKRSKRSILTVQFQKLWFELTWMSRVNVNHDKSMWGRRMTMLLLSHNLYSRGHTQCLF